MPVFLFLLGVILVGVGLFLVGFSVPFRDFSLGNTLIISGAVSIVGGLVLIGIGAVLRELRKITKSLEAGGSIRPAAVTPPPVAATASTARPAPQPAAPARPPARPAVVNTSRSLRAEPRLETPDLDPVVPEPPAPLTPSAPTVADVTAERPQRGLFASIRGRSKATPQVSSRSGPGPISAAPTPPVPAAEVADEDHPLPPLPRGGHTDRAPFQAEREPSPETSPTPRSPSLAALAARTAARLDLPHPVPDLPRAGAERTPRELEAHEPPSYEPPPYEPPSPYEPPAPEPLPERPSRNMFDTVWPNDGKEPLERNAEPPPPEPRAPEILKSGVIDGMAYTLYTDGSIEAQLPQGTLRFTSIDDLRAHLERGG